MSGTRRAMDWDGTVIPTVLKAVDDYNKQRPFVNTKSLALHIMENRMKYPFFIDASSRQISQRVGTSMKMMNWRQFNRNSRSSGGRVFVDPRYSEARG